MKLRADLHIHSEYSFDSKNKLKKIIFRAKKNKIDIIAITDHEETKGAQIAQKISKDLMIIIGEEIDTEYGDVVGLFLKKKIHSTKFKEVIKEIKSQGGLIMIPHPALHHILTEDFIKNADLIETFNSRIGSELNDMAKLVSKENSIPGVAGSDAHFLFEIGNGVTIIESKSMEIKDIKKALSDGHFKLAVKKSPKIKRYFAKIVKIWRRR